MPAQAKIVVVVPSIRPESHAAFVKAWKPLFEKHKVTLITVWDEESPSIDIQRSSDWVKHTITGSVLGCEPWLTDANLFCRFTDACRNVGFVAAAQMKPDYILTLDDDVVPIPSQNDGPYFISGNDPIQAHIDALNRRVPLSWMNTAHDTDLYLRGVPYEIRDEAPVMLSHGVWVGTPDFDGETQLRLEEENKGDYIAPDGTHRTTRLPYSLPYYVGPIPKGVMFPLSGMNVMVRREALPYLYFAPMGPDTGIAGLNRFSDIWMGVCLKKRFDELGWACVTGYSTILHTRASDARKNFEQEKLGREWNEYLWKMGSLERPVAGVCPGGVAKYLVAYADKRTRYEKLITNILTP